MKRPVPPTLTAAAERRTAAADALTAATEHLYAEIIAAHNAGVRGVDIAAGTGLTRARIYQIITESTQRHAPRAPAA